MDSLTRLAITIGFGPDAQVEPSIWCGDDDVFQVNKTPLTFRSLGQPSEYVWLISANKYSKLAESITETVIGGLP